MNRYNIIKESHPYYILQDTSQINQFCVMLKTGLGFSQQISPWYFRKGNAIRFYNKKLQQATRAILDKQPYITKQS